MIDVVVEATVDILENLKFKINYFSDFFNKGSNICQYEWNSDYYIDVSLVGFEKNADILHAILIFKNFYWTLLI